MIYAASGPLNFVLKVIGIAETMLQMLNRCRLRSCSIDRGEDLSRDKRPDALQIKLRLHVHRKI